MKLIGVVCGAVLLLSGCNEAPKVKKPEISYATAIRCTVLGGRLEKSPELEAEIGRRIREKKKDFVGASPEDMVQHYRKYEWSFKGYALGAADKMKKSPADVENDLAEASNILSTAEDNPKDENNVATFLEWVREWGGVCQPAMKGLPD